MKYIQCRNCHKLFPADEYDEHVGRVSPERSHGVSGDIEPFISSVDGTVIGSRSALREHNKKHGVVTAAEYGGYVNPEAKKRRDDFYLGRHSTQEKFKRKQEIHEIINRLERR